MIKVFIFLHVISGIGALLGLVGALATQKGSFWHKRLGRFYAVSMALALLLAFIVSVITNNIFLLLIGLLSAYFVYTGWRLAVVKDGAKSSLDKQVSKLMLLCAVAMVGYGIYLWIIGESLGITLFVFGFFAFLPAFTDVKLVAWPKGKQRIVWHLGRMGGASIATVTAVFVVNISTNPAFIAWLLPSLVGTPLIIYWSRRASA